MTKEEFEKIKATRLDIASRKRDSGSFETIQFADAREIDYLLELIKGVSFDGIDEKIAKANEQLKNELKEAIKEIDNKYETKTNELNDKIVTLPKLPIGSMIQFTGAIIPDGWAYCNGNEMADVKFEKLKEIIGIQFNNKLPDIDNYIISYK